MTINKARVKPTRNPRKLNKTILKETQKETGEGLSDEDIIQLRAEKYLHQSTVRFFDWLCDHIELYRAQPILIKNTPPREQVYRLKCEGTIVDIVVRV